MVEFSLTLLVQWVNFGILFFLLSRVLFRPMIEVLDSRRTQIETTQEETARNRNQAQSLAIEARERLNALEKEAVVLLQEARKEAEATRGEMVGRAKEEARSLLLAARGQAQRDAEQARRTLTSEIAALSLQAAEQVIGREIHSEDHNRFFEDFLKTMEAKG